MKPQILFLPPALSDIETAYCWYEDQQSGLGASFLNDLERAQELIQENPQLFRKIHRDIRRVVLNHFLYSVFYLWHPDIVSVLAVLHHARNPQTWRQRG